MEDLLQFVPEDKKEEFKAVANNYVKADEETLISAVKERQNVFDKITAGPMDSRLNNWKEKELPKVLEAERDKIRKELNPEETPEQKEIRELKEWKQQQLKDKELVERREELRGQYKDYAFIVDDISSLEDSKIESVISKFDELNKKIADLEASKKYGAGAPHGGQGARPTGSILGTRGEREAAIRSRFPDLEG